MLHARARGILGDDAEAGDAVQETFARVLRAGDAFRRESSPLTWLYQINTNWCLNRLRNRKGHQRKHEERRADVVPREEVEPEVDQLDNARLRALLADEDEETQRIVLHVFFDDMTREETAVLVGISVPTLRKRLDGFLKRARRELGVPAAGLVLVAVAFWFLGGGQ
jgi:RNA polymerase sigma-70 factor (ECF subfamily)